MSWKGSVVTVFLALLAAGCGDDAPATADLPDGGALADSGNPVVPGVLRRPSKTSTVAITGDDRFVLMVNPDDNSLSIFETATDTRTARVPVGAEPSAVVIAPDGTTAYVANRADATVVKVTGIYTGNPGISPPLAVGSEPTGLALSPTGARLYVAEFAEGSFAVIDTAAMTVSSVVKGAIRHPFAIAVTNDGDQDDDDELIIVPEFYGEATGEEGSFATLDRQRRGRVRIYSTKTLTAQEGITFEPRDSLVKPDNAAVTETVDTSPNQLYAVAIRRDPAAPGDNSRDKIYIPTVSASAAAPVVYDGNQYPVLLAGDLGARREITSGPEASFNLFERILGFKSDGPLAGKTLEAGSKKDKFFMTEIVDLDFLPVSGAAAEANVAYVVSRGADAIQRITFDPVKGAVLGSSANMQIDIGGSPGLHDDCKGATGIVLRHDGAKAYLNCWVSQNLGVVKLGSTQALEKAVPAFSPDPSRTSIDRGRRFFTTGRVRWSGDAKVNAADQPPTLTNLGVGSCAGCHPFGLSDNITWAFAAGPRQTTSMDGSFSKGPVKRQRAFNWTAINDELHDFERNTRDTSGGLGALTQADPAGDCGKLDRESRVVLAGQLNAGVKLLQKGPAFPNHCTNDFDDMEAWVRTIRPPRALRRLEQAKIDLGREIFTRMGTATNAGNCASCHSGPGWTVSHVFYTFDAATDVTVPLHAAALDATTLPAGQNNHLFQIEAERVGAGTRGPEQVACVLRNVRTFGPAELEKRIVAGNVVPSQGESGYNVPSLYGLQLGAPYLHAGAAATLDELFAKHFTAGNDNFSPSAAEAEALEQFLLSIDATTPEVGTPPGLDICPVRFP